jgi:sodium-dependent dicarboxylate transporter 2/3/5
MEVGRGSLKEPLIDPAPVTRVSTPGRQRRNAASAKQVALFNTQTRRKVGWFMFSLLLHFLLYPLKIGENLSAFTPSEAARQKVLANFPDGGAAERGKVLAVVVLVVTLWLTQPIPVCIAALVPVISFPFLGVASGDELAPQYFKDLMLLFVGTSFLGQAITRVRLHRRIALSILKRTGTSPQWVLAGFYGVASFLSMWISNTSTTVMLVPIAIDTVDRLQDELSNAPHFRTALVLGIGYAANIGGMGTLIGTAPNLIAQEIFSSLFPTAPPITFFQWAEFGMPLVLVLVVVLWLFMRLVYCGLPEVSLLQRLGIPPPLRHLGSGGGNMFEEELTRMGPCSSNELVVLAAFVLLLVMLFFRDPGFAPGFADWFAVPSDITSGGISILVALPLFLVPLDQHTGTTGSASEGSEGSEMGIIVQDASHDDAVLSGQSSTEELRDQGSSSGRNSALRQRASSSSLRERSSSSSVRNRSSSSSSSSSTLLDPKVVGHREISVLGVARAALVEELKEPEVPTILDSTSVQVCRTVLAHCALCPAGMAYCTCTLHTVSCRYGVLYLHTAVLTHYCTCTHTLMYSHTAVLTHYCTHALLYSHTVFCRR